MRTTGFRTRELYLAGRAGPWTDRRRVLPTPWTSPSCVHGAAAASHQGIPMRLTPLLLCLLATGAGARMQVSTDFASRFTGDTMRVDYFHTGGPGSGEVIALDRVVNDGAWPGSRTQL